MSSSDWVPAPRYYDPDFYAMECELLWPRVWQMACRLEEIPQPGDFVEYEILGRSVVVVRLAADEVKAYHNTCRHRGVKLVLDRGSIPNGFVCPFHGWCYGLDGQNTFVYQPDLFAEDHLAQEDLALRECRLELWGGCAFINFDDSAPPLRNSLEPFATILDAWHAESLRVEWWMSCRLPTNWKLAMEAFMEGYHVMQTHPQVLPASARGKSASYKAAEGRPTLNAQLGSGQTMTAAEYIDSQIQFMRVFGQSMQSMTHKKDIRVAEQLRHLDLPEDPVARAETWRFALNDAIVDWNRSAGMDVPDLNQLAASGHTTNVLYSFPHFFMLPMYSSGASYRIRPLGPEECLFELWGLTRYPEGEEPPRPIRPKPLAPDDPRWPEFPAQDFSNLPRQQLGLHGKGFERMRLSNKVEGLIGNFERVVDGYLAGLDHEMLLGAIQQVNGPIDAPCKDLGF